MICLMHSRSWKTRGKHESVSVVKSKSERERQGGKERERERVCVREREKGRNDGNDVQPPAIKNRVFGIRRSLRCNLKSWNWNGGPRITIQSDNWTTLILQRPSLSLSLSLSLLFRFHKYEQNPTSLIIFYVLISIIFQLLLNQNYSLMRLLSS